MQAMRVVVVLTAAAACASPRAAAACARDMLMVSPPFAAKAAELGRKAAITRPRTKRMTQLRFGFEALTRDGVFGCIEDI
jgi:hypothetical protein